MRSPRRLRGFTLIEMLIVMAIIGVMVALAVWGLSYGSQRARMNNAAYEASSMISVAKLRAAVSGQPNYVIFYQSDNGDYGVVHLERQESTAATVPTWDDTATGVDANDITTWMASGNDLIIDRLNLNLTGGVLFEDLANFRTSLAEGATALPAPFTSVNLTGVGATGLLAGCNFCRAVTNGTMGVLRFTGDGLVTSPTAPTVMGLAIGLGQILPDAERLPRTPRRLLVVATPAGATRVF